MASSLRQRFLTFLILLSFLSINLPGPTQASASGTPQGQIAGTGPVVSPPVEPADTAGLPPAPLSEPSGGEPREVLSRPAPPPVDTTQSFAVEEDPVLQSGPGTKPAPAPLLNFEGISNRDSVLPPDTTGQVGPDHYVQMVNLSTAVYDKQGNLLYGPFHPSDLWPAGDPCRLSNDGDPVVLYDQLSDRWLVTQFALPHYPNGPFYQCMAVSRGPEPTNRPADWFAYTFLAHGSKMNDYPKLGVWPDGYYMSANQFPAPGSGVPASVGVWVFDRRRMLNGQAASFQYFDLLDANPDYWSLLPSNLMGSTPPPPGAPNYFASANQDWFGADDVLHIFEFHTDWANPANTTFRLTRDLVVAPYDAVFSNGRHNVPQPNPGPGLDAIGGRMMMHLWYRNFGDHDVLVANHTVDAGSQDHAGIRWYEVRNPGAGAILFQQGTYAPDQHHRWMGSIAMDSAGNIALGYSISSSELYPGIRYTGREAGDPLGQFTLQEGLIVNGSGVQTHQAARWGDYSAMSVDPVDDCTFWYTQQYIRTIGPAAWQTRIAAFRFPGCTASRGLLSGVVTDENGAPLAGARVSAQEAKTLVAYSGEDGSYGFSTLPVGTYTVSVEAYGYQPESVENVEIREGQTEEINFSLSPAPTALVTGVVRDAGTGWPLYARLTVEDYPGDPVWTDPVSGAYEIRLVQNHAYTFHVTAWNAGYEETTGALTLQASDRVQDFHLSADRGICRAPGYQPASTAFQEDFESSNGGFSHSGVEDEWAWGTPSAWPGGCASGANCWGTDLGGNYNAGANQELLSAEIDLSAYPAGTDLTVHWQQAWAVESSSYDTALAQVRFNSGPWQEMWRHVGPTSRTDWTAMSAGISPAAAGHVQFRWLLESDSGTEYEGLYVDDLVITAGCETPDGSLLVGSVFNGENEPLAGALVAHTGGLETQAQPTPLDAAVPDSLYVLYSPPGEQTFTAAGIYGYGRQQVSLNIPVGETLRQDFVLPPAELYTVEGRVADAAAGWPLYAQIRIDGYPGDPIWTDPETGSYQITLPEAVDYAFNVTAWVAGYQPAVQPVNDLAGNTSLDIGLAANQSPCLAPGYTAEGGIAERFDSNAPPPGWTVVNNTGQAGWSFDNPGRRANTTGGMGNFAIADSDKAGRVKMDTELRSPLLDFSGEDRVVLSFKTDFNAFASQDTGEVDVSLNGAAGPWTNVWRKVGVDYRGPQVETIDLTALAAGRANVMLRFHYYNVDWAWWWQIDDLTLGEPRCLPPPEGGLVLGNVTDANTGDPLSGVVVTSDGGTATTPHFKTPPAVDDSFFTLFSPSGSHVFTAAVHSAYGPAVQTVQVLDRAAVRRDFALPAGRLQASPPSLNAALEMGAQGTLSLDLQNTGSLPASFDLLPFGREMVPLGPFEESQYVVKPFKQDYLPAAPSGDRPLIPALPLDAGSVVQAWPAGLSKPWGIAFDGLRDTVWVSSPAEAWGGSDFVHEFTPPGFPTKQAFPHTPPHEHGPADLAYNWQTGMIWALHVNSGIGNCIYEIDPQEGYTGEKVCPGGPQGFANAQQGLAYDPASDTWFGGGWNDGMIYRFDAGGEILSSKSMGLSISGLAYNPDSGHLFVMNSSSPTQVYVLDVEDNYNILGQFSIPGFSPLGGAGLEMDCEGRLWAADQVSGLIYQFESGEATSVCGPSVSWLTLDPVHGAVPAQEAQAITLQLDGGSSELARPGDYLAQIRVQHDTPYRVDRIPVTLTVSAPPTFGFVQGQVNSPGYCDQAPGPLGGALVTAAGKDGKRWTQKTAPDGSYEIWLDPAFGPYSLTVERQGYEIGQASGIQIRQAEPQQQDFDLRWMKACLQVEPQELIAVIKVRQSKSVSLELRNSGPVSAVYTLKSDPDESCMVSGQGSAVYPWLSFTPGSGIVPAGGTQQLQVRVNGSEFSQAGEYDASFKLCTNDPLKRSILVPVQVRVVLSDQVAILPEEAYFALKPGQEGTYSFEAANFGEEQDTIHLSIEAGDSGWTAVLMQSTLTLNAGERASFNVRAAIPASARPVDRREFLITAVSSNDPQRSSSARLVVTAFGPWRYFPFAFLRGSPVSP